MIALTFPLVQTNYRGHLLGVEADPEQAGGQFFKILEAMIKKLSIANLGFCGKY
jgi:hypothetical protein